MNNLGLYYQNIKKDYAKTKEYFLMAIDKGNLTAMVSLGLHYQYIEKDLQRLFICLC